MLSFGILTTKEREPDMADKPVPAASIAKVEEFMLWLSTYYAVAIVGTADYFGRPTATVDSEQLRDLQLFVAKVVSEHDKLADATGKPRLVGKRGRKASDVSTVVTAETIMAQFNKRK
jgi:hypothetical protein